MRARSSKRDCRKWVSKGHGYYQLSQATFPKSYRREAFSPAYALKATGPSASHSVPSHSQAKQRPWGHSAPGATPPLPAGQDPGPSLSSPSSAQAIGARNNREKNQGSTCIAQMAHTSKEGGDKDLYLATSQGAR